jgi:hypothetical protein
LLILLCEAIEFVCKFSVGGFFVINFRVFVVSFSVAIYQF